MNKFVKWTLISLPILAGGVIVYLQLKKKHPQQSPITTNNSGTQGPGLAQQSDQAAGLSTAQINAKYFPLQSGSNNQYVGELQDVLGVTIDNKFGPGTLAALQAQASVNAVADLATLNSIEDSILATDQAAATVAARTSASQSLLALFQNMLMNGVQLITPSTDTTWYSVTQDNNGNWNRSGQQLSLTAGQVLSLSSYNLVTVDPNTGNLIINCLGDNMLFSGFLFGSNKGYWMADPTPLVIS